MRKGPRHLGGLFSAAILAVAGVLLGVLCFREAAVRALPANSPDIVRLAPHHPDVVLGQAEADLVARNGILPPATLDAVRGAAARAPLDGRAFLILGHQQLLDRQPARAVRTLEAGQRLDPRNSLIHLLLLDRYLRTARYADAAAQFSVLGRLVGSVGGPIAAAVAQMSRMPETHDAVRRTLGTDPALERAVLITLAKSDTAPPEIFALASPAARRDARAQDSWGSVLVARLVARGRHDVARSVWRRVYGLSDAQVAPLLFDAGLQELPGSPPFNWTLAAGSIGAADIAGGALAIDYYGRDSGELASQLLVLAPGSYRFGFSVEGSKANEGPALFWSLRCASGAKRDLMRAAVVATGAPRRVATGVTVPVGCPAQQLALVGEAGEFAAPINVLLRDLSLRAAPGGRP